MPRLEYLNLVWTICLLIGEIFCTGNVKVTCQRQYWGLRGTGQTSYTIQDIVAPGEGAWGGKSVDAAFYAFLCEICGPLIMESLISEEYEDYIHLFREFETKKRSIRSYNKNKVVINLPVSLSDLVRQKHGVFEREIEQSAYKETVIFSKQKLHISPDTFKGLFEPSIRGIIKHIEEMQKNPKVEDTDILMMVGGFVECKLVQNAVRSYFGKSKSIIIPEEAGMAVMKGAVLLPFESKDKARRIARFSYGFSYLADWDPDIHPESKYVLINGKRKCKDVFFKLVAKGEVFRTDYQISAVISVPINSSNTFPCLIYISTDPNPRYTTDHGCKRVLHFPVSVPITDHDLELEVTLIFEDLKILVRVRDINSGSISEQYMEYPCFANDNTDSLSSILSKMHGNDFKDLISKGDFASYENRVYLAGACNTGKSSLASILIGDEVPEKWHSTDGLVIHYGRNGIHLEDKKMIPLRKSDTNIIKKLLLGNPNFEDMTTDNSESNLPTYIQNRVKVDSQLETASNLPSEHTEPAEKAIENLLTNHTSAELTTFPENRKKQQDMLAVEVKVKEQSNIPLPHVTRQTSNSIQSDALQEIRDGTYKIRVAPSDLVDFGGQRSFDMTHQLFIQHKGTFVLMFGGRYRLHSPLKEYPQGDITAKDILVHWVNSILIYCGEGDDTMPMILFAATHSDQLLLDQIPAQKAIYISELTKLFQRHNQRKHIIFYRLFFINATISTDPEIEDLKDALVDIAFQQPTWGQRMPIAWVPLELQISEFRTKGINLVTKEKIQELNLSNPEFMLNEFRLDEFLKLQHSLGKIMYFDQPALQDFVIIQPSAMVNILRSFVTDKMFWPEDRGLRKTLEGMVSTGTVKKKQLFDLWSQPQFNEILSSTQHKEYIIQVLVHLDILVEPKREDNQCSQNETYLVPCLVKNTLPVELLKFEEQKTICLAYQLTENLIPSSLTFKLIGAAIATWPLKEAKGRICLYYQSAIMHVDESNELLMIIKGQRVELYLSNQSSKHLISPDVAASIQECLTLVLQRVLLFYHECFGRSTTKLAVLNLFEIEVGVICKGELCVVPLFQAEKKKPWTCEKNKKEHETRYCLYWVFNKHIRTCDVTCKGLETEALSLRPNDQHLVRLAKQIGINLFDQFLIHLGITRDEWEDIEYQYRQNGMLGMKLMALYEWKKKNETVKLQELWYALNGIERPHYLCQIVREDTNLYGIAESRLQKSPTDEVLNELSRRLGNCVIQLGIELGINFRSIEESMYRFPKDMYGQIYDILKKWKQQTSITPTIHRLMMALQRVDPGGLSYLRVKYK